ncbi:MAG: 50S ribosomal protein L28 [Planctomycetes bacterium]|nr:50S ribosomal protein L28 [Planctomycetota bacterium]
MARVCQITGRKTTVGNQITRKGKAKREGGVGKKTTGISKRRFKINLHWRRFWVPELDRFVRLRVSTKGVRIMERNGVYQTLLRAGLVKPPKPKRLRKPRVQAPPAPPVAAAGV